MLATVVGSSLTKGVTIAAQAGNLIGAATVAAISAVEATGKSDAEKKGDVLAAVAPVVLAEAAKDSFSTVAKDAEHFRPCRRGGHHDDEADAGRADRRRVAPGAPH